jgi:hypothetical protein
VWDLIIDKAEEPDGSQIAMLWIVQKQTKQGKGVFMLCYRVDECPLGIE